MPQVQRAAVQCGTSMRLWKQWMLHMDEFKALIATGQAEEVPKGMKEAQEMSIGSNGFWPALSSSLERRAWRSRNG